MATAHHISSMDFFWGGERGGLEEFYLRNLAVLSSTLGLKHEEA